MSIYPCCFTSHFARLSLRALHCSHKLQCIYVFFEDSPEFSYTSRCLTCSCSRTPLTHLCRCDRKIPCSACVRHSVECVFDPSHPPRNRNKRLKTQVLADRIKQYEAILRDKGIDPDLLQTRAASEPRYRSSHVGEVALNDTVSHSQLEPARSINKAPVIQIPGRLKFFDKSENLFPYLLVHALIFSSVLWTRIIEEVSAITCFMWLTVSLTTCVLISDMNQLPDPRDALEETSDITNDTDASDDGLGFVLDDQPRANSKARHPSPQRIHQLWQIYSENIDPLTKLLHIPTLRPAVEKAAKKTDAIPREFEALMFAVYSAAVMSLNDEECVQRLGEPRRVLLIRYVSATKKALRQANFMGTTSLIVLQALVIHILSIRDISQPRAVWSLTGVALRIAQGLGLERDGAYLGLSPFESEMRRRIWWQLKMHDFRAAELCGIGKFQNLHTGGEYTDWPTNVNDDQLYPGMASLTPESGKLTDTAFVSWKCELLNHVARCVDDLRRQGKNHSPWDPQKREEDDSDESEQSLRDFEELLESKYLRYCDPSQPLHLVTMLMARSSINVIRFMSNHPRRWGSKEQTPLSQRQMVWDICIKLLEQHNMLQSNPFLRRFAWYAPYFQQWHAIIHILDTLRADPLKADADKAWERIENVYACNPDLISDMRKPIHVAVAGLCLKAYANRETALQDTNGGIQPTPQFIAQLRQQREQAKARRQEQDANSGQAEIRNAVRNNVVTNSVDGARPRSEAENTGGNMNIALDSTHLQNMTSIPAPFLSSEHTLVAPQTEPTGFTYGFDDGQANDMMDFNVDLDLILAQDQGEDSATHAIRWDQWDSWLGNSNMARPFSTGEDFAASN